MKKILASCFALAMCMFFTVSALAADFTPSVEYKPAPEFVPITDAEGNQVTAIITDADGNQISIPEDVELVITPTSGKDETLIPEIREMLLRAEQQIADADHLGELTPDLADALAELQASSAGAAFRNVTLEDLVVRDLFDVSFVRDGKTLEHLLQEGQTVTFALTTDLTEDDLFFVLHNYREEEWEVVKNVTVQDGVMTITLGGLSPIAIVVDGSSVMPANEDSPSSPQTGTRRPVEYLIGAAILGGAAITFFCLGKKRKAA